MGFFDRFRSPKGANKERKPTEARKEAVNPGKPAKKNAADPNAMFRAVSAGQTPGKDEKTAAKQRVAKDDTRQAYRILLAPIVTEKSSILAGHAEPQYTFLVSQAASKIEVRKAVRAVYGILPRQVTISNRQGKDVRYGRARGTTSQWKKAVITLGPGQKIDLGEG